MTSILKSFVSLLCGHFDNSAQVETLRAKGDDTFPAAEHVNTACNDKLRNLPDDFDGCFILEESYYTVRGKTNASPHLFCFTEDNGEITLTSYDLPDGVDQSLLTAATFPVVDFRELKPSEKFTPAVYHLRDGVWEGGSESMFSPVLKFTLFERFSEELLEVTETMEVNGRRTFGYDEPILYRRQKK